MFNLKPDSNGLVTARLQDLGNYNQVFIVGCDSDSAVQRAVSVASLLNQAAAPEIPMRDLTLDKKAEADDKGLTDSRQADCLPQSAQVHIEDITSSKVQIVDNAEKIFKVVQELGKFRGSSGSSQIDQLIEPLFLSWHTFDFAKKVKQFSQYVCHELNFFLFKRDKPFYDQVVRGYIENKMEKTFIDWYLLGSDDGADSAYTQCILQYFDIESEMKRLNFIEVCLLMETCIKYGSDRHKEKAHSLAKSLIKVQEWESVQEDPNARNRVFDFVINLSNLDKEQNLNLEDIKLEDEEQALTEEEALELTEERMLE